VHAAAAPQGTGFVVVEGDKSGGVGTPSAEAKRPSSGTGRAGSSRRGKEGSSSGGGAGKDKHTSSHLEPGYVCASSGGARDGRGPKGVKGVKGGTERVGGQRPHARQQIEEEEEEEEEEEGSQSHLASKFNLLQLMGEDE